MTTLTCRDGAAVLTDYLEGVLPADDRAQLCQQAILVRGEGEHRVTVVHQHLDAASQSRPGSAGRAQDLVVPT